MGGGTGSTENRKKDFISKFSRVEFNDSLVKYEVKITQKEIVRSLYFTQGRKIDKRYLLEKDTAGEREKIFGIADDLEEADKRTYEEGKKIFRELNNIYLEEGNVEIIDNTERGKVNQLEIDVKNS